MIDAQPLAQAPVLEIEAPPQGGRDAYDGAQVVYSKPGTLCGEVHGGLLPMWEILKGLFVGYA